VKRRDFINWVGLGWLATSLPVALAACSPETPSANTGASTGGSPLPSPPANPTTTASAAGAFTQVGTVADLDKSGSLAVKIGGEDAIVIRDPANSANLIAVNATCTHKGCKVKWESSEKRFDCPCHGADFDTAGKPVKGPAKTPLAVYSAKVNGANVMVQA
jgi:cytochrome b6-f complex iron-sulfur subunit